MPGDAQALNHEMSPKIKINCVFLNNFLPWRGVGAWGGECYFAASISHRD